MSWLSKFHIFSNEGGLRQVVDSVQVGSECASDSPEGMMGADAGSFANNSQMDTLRFIKG